MSYTRLAGPRVGFDTAAQTPLQRALQACRKQFVVVGLFSGVVNLLQLTTSIYMMQVFDRVLASRILDTLYYLSLIAIVATLVLALLEAVRGQVMQRLATWVEHRVASRCMTWPRTASSKARTSVATMAISDRKYRVSRIRLASTRSNTCIM